MDALEFRSQNVHIYLHIIFGSGQKTCHRASAAANSSIYLLSYPVIPSSVHQFVAQSFAEPSPFSFAICYRGWHSTWCGIRCSYVDIWIKPTHLPIQTSLTRHQRAWKPWTYHTLHSPGSLAREACPYAHRAYHSPPYAHPPEPCRSSWCRLPPREGRQSSLEMWRIPRLPLSSMKLKTISVTLHRSWRTLPSASSTRTRKMSAVSSRQSVPTLAPLT